MSAPSGNDPRRDSHRASQFLVFAGALLLALVMRLHNHADEVIDWDESTFILVAHGILDGHLPYTVWWDIKPPMMFFALAGVMAVFGETLETVRLTGAVLVAVAVAAVYPVLRARFGPGPALLAVALGAALASAPSLQPTMTEHLVIALIAPALALLVRSPTAPALFAVGLCLSLATLTRTNIAVPSVLTAAYLIYAFWRFPGSISGRAIVALVAGGVLPAAGLLALYGTAGHLDIFIDSVVAMPLMFSSERNAMIIAIAELPFAIGSLAVEDPLVWGPAILVAGAGAWRLRRAKAPAGGPLSSDRVFLGFGAATALSMVLTGSVLKHHVLQLLPLAMYLAAAALAHIEGQRARQTALALVVVAISAGVAVNGWRTVQWALADNDTHRIEKAAELIRADMAPEDRVFATIDHLILWYLDVPPVIPIAVHPTNLIHRHIHEPMAELGHAPPAPFEAILATRPRYVIATDTAPWHLRGPEWEILSDALSDGYDRWQQVDRLVIFRRKEESWRG